LFPVWACEDKSSGTEYIEQVHLLLDIIQLTPLAPCAIFAGDFNSNAKWDGGYVLPQLGGEGALILRKDFSFPTRP